MKAGESQLIYIKVKRVGYFLAFGLKCTMLGEMLRLFWDNIDPCLLAAISGVSGSWLICMKSTASSPAL